MSMMRDLYVTGTFPSLKVIADRITVHVKSEVQISSDLSLAIVPDLILISYQGRCQTRPTLVSI
jgi:hypothetical protein